MIIINFGKWSSRAGKLFLSKRVYTKNRKWTPFCMLEIRYKLEEKRIVEEGMEFSEVRKRMAVYLEGDEDLFYGYQSNIACLLHDGFSDKRFTKSWKGCNAAAVAIMCLIFSIPPRLKEQRNNGE